MEAVHAAMVSSLASHRTKASGQMSKQMLLDRLEGSRSTMRWGYSNGPQAVVSTGYTVCCKACALAPMCARRPVHVLVEPRPYAVCRTEAPLRRSVHVVSRRPYFTPRHLSGTWPEARKHSLTFCCCPAPASVQAGMGMSTKVSSKSTTNSGAR